MDNTSANDGKLAVVQRLATTLADRVLDSQIAVRAIPPDHITALISAAHVLRDYDLPWPPLLEQVLHEFANGIDAKQAISETAEPERKDVVKGLSRFLSDIWRENDVSRGASS